MNFNLQGQIWHENMEDGKAVLHLGPSCSLKHTSRKMAVHPMGLWGAHGSQWCLAPSLAHLGAQLLCSTGFHFSTGSHSVAVIYWTFFDTLLQMLDHLNTCCINSVFLFSHLHFHHGSSFPGTTVNPLCPLLCAAPDSHWPISPPQPAQPHQCWDKSSSTSSFFSSKNFSF